MEKTYKLRVAGLERDLKILPVSDEVSIASFVMLGDTELVEKCAEAITERIKGYEIDYLITPESKAIAFTHAVAKRLGINYIVIRKSMKNYMSDVIVHTVQSITTPGTQKLILDGDDARKIYGKKVCIIDDVVSTGASLTAVRQCLAKTSCEIVAEAAVLLEESGFEDHNLIYLERLPIFKK